MADEKNAQRRQGKIAESVSRVGDDNGISDVRQYVN
jgi:hypothetical protein